MLVDFSSQLFNNAIFISTSLKPKIKKKFYLTHKLIDIYQKKEIYIEETKHFIRFSFIVLFLNIYVNILLINIR